MFRLASELGAAGMRVVTTTTTHISEDQVQFAPSFILPERIDLLAERLDRFGHCLIAGPPDGKGRVHGVLPELIALLKERSDVDIIVVEADGSRSLPFKAPGAHEPVVPDITTILVPIAGLDALGQPLDDAHVHRPEIIASLAQQRPGSLVTGETVARVLSHPQGGAKQLPAGARLVPVLNLADDETAVPRAREIAQKLLKLAVADSVIISAMRGEPPVRETWAPIAGVILAEGQSMGRGSMDHVLPPKHLSLAVNAARVALEAGLDPVVAVLRRQAEEVAQALAGMPVCTIVHTHFEASRSSSVRMAIEALPERTGAAVIMAAGQPVAAVGAVRDLVRAHRRSFAPACAFGFDDNFANPVLFDRSLFRELRESGREAGWRLLLEKYRDSLVIIG